MQFPKKAIQKIGEQNTVASIYKDNLDLTLQLT